MLFTDISNYRTCSTHHLLQQHPNERIYRVAGSPGEIKHFSSLKYGKGARFLQRTIFTTCIRILDVFLTTYQVEPRFWNEVDQWRKDLERPRSFRKNHGVVADQIVRLEKQAVAVAAAVAVVEGGYAQHAVVMRRQTV